MPKQTKPAAAKKAVPKKVVKPAEPKARKLKPVTIKTIDGITAVYIGNKYHKEGSKTDCKQWSDALKASMKGCVKNLMENRNLSEQEAVEITNNKY